MSSPWRVRNSSGSEGSGQSSTSRRPPGRSAAHAARRTAGGVVELVERVLEVGQVEVAGLAGRLALALADRDPVGQPGRLDVRAGAGDGIGLELDADELELREAPGHRDEPAAAAAVDVDDAPAPRQVRDQLRQRASASWKKTAMSWAVSRSIATR